MNIRLKLQEDRLDVLDEGFSKDMLYSIPDELMERYRKAIDEYLLALRDITRLMRVQDDLFPHPPE